MQLLITIIAFLVIFSVLILVHEFGHFYMAKRNGIKVEEFGFGLPPRIWGIKKGETLYSINWIPFGGFVRMLGEDARDKKGARSKRSFLKKSLWQRTQVVCAGVVMNLMLAWVLLSAGFMIGMQPLVVDQGEFLHQVEEGRIELAYGMLVDSVQPDSWAERVGFEPGDLITTLNGEPVQELSIFNEATLSEEGFSLNGYTFVPTEEEPNAGLAFNVFELPRVVIESVREDYSNVLFEPGDVIWTVNDQPILYADDFYESLHLAEKGVVDVEVYRQGELVELSWTYSHPGRVVISRVLEGSPAEAGGLQVGDRVLQVNDQDVWSPAQVVEVVTQSDVDTIDYEVERDGQVYRFRMTRNEEGLVGVMLAPIFTPTELMFNYYDGIQITSVVSVENVQYSVWEAPWQALVEIKRMGAYTLVMIGQVFGEIFTTGDVPEGVAGPVGIAQMTGVYVQEGIVSLMRFTALLSLSLAVINIFPFPALDGGRFLFIIIEAIRGRPVDSKLEGIIHSIGFVLLLFVIFLVTFEDLRRLFS